MFDEGDVEVSEKLVDGVDDVEVVEVFEKEVDEIGELDVNVMELQGNQFDLEILVKVVVVVIFLFVESIVEVIKLILEFMVKVEVIEDWLIEMEVFCVLICKGFGVDELNGLLVVFK